MDHIILFIHVLAAFGVTGLVLIQHGKGADVGASFGSGASQTIFGSSGSGSFLSRLTAILVTIFFVTCLTLGVLTSKRYQAKGIDELLKNVGTQEIVKGQETVKKGEASQEIKKDNDIPTVPSN